MADIKYDLEDRLVDFSCRIIEVVEALPGTRAGNYISAQIDKMRIGSCIVVWRSTRCRCC